MDPLFTEIINAETSAESIIRDRLEALDQWMRDPIQDPLSEVYTFFQGRLRSTGVAGMSGDAMDVHDEDWTETAVFVERVLNYLYPTRRSIHEHSADRQSVISDKINEFQKQTETTQLTKLEQRITRQIEQLRIVTTHLESRSVKVPGWLNADKLEAKLKAEARSKSKELAKKKAGEKTEAVELDEKLKLESAESAGESEVETSGCVTGDKAAEEAEEAVRRDSIQLDAQIRGENPKEALLADDAKTADAEAVDSVQGGACGGGGGSANDCTEQVNPCECPPEPTETEKKLPVKPQLLTYVVVKGDWLSKIAKDKLGDVGRWRELYELNRSVIDKENLKRRGNTDKSFNWIYPGQILTLPPTEVEPETEENPELEDAELDAEEKAAKDPGEDCDCDEPEEEIEDPDGGLEIDIEVKKTTDTTITEDTTTTEDITTTTTTKVTPPTEKIIQVPYTVKRTRPVTVTKTRPVKKIRPVTVSKTRMKKYQETIMVPVPREVTKYTVIEVPKYRTESTPIIEKRKQSVPGKTVKKAVTKMEPRTRRWTERKVTPKTRTIKNPNPRMIPGPEVEKKVPYTHVWTEDVVRFEKRWLEKKLKPPKPKKPDYGCGEGVPRYMCSTASSRNKGDDVTRRNKGGGDGGKLMKAHKEGRQLKSREVTGRASAGRDAIIARTRQKQDGGYKHHDMFKVNGKDSRKSGGRSDDLPGEPQPPEILEAQLEEDDSGLIGTECPICGGSDSSCSKCSEQPDDPSVAIDAAADTRGGMVLKSEPVDTELIKWESYWVKFVEAVEHSEQRYRIEKVPGKPIPDPTDLTITEPYEDVELIPHEETEQVPVTTMEEVTEPDSETEVEVIVGYNTEIIPDGVEITKYPYVTVEVDEVPEVREYEIEETYEEEETEEYEEEETYEEEEIEEYEETLWREVTVLEGGSTETSTETTSVSQTTTTLTEESTETIDVSIHIRELEQRKKKEEEDDAANETESQSETGQQVTEQRSEREQQARELIALQEQVRQEQATQQAQQEQLQQQVNQQVTLSQQQEKAEALKTSEPELDKETDKEQETDSQETVGEQVTTTTQDAPEADDIPEDRTHTVVEGDWLSKLAKTYYGDASKWRIIYEANKEQIDRDNLKRRGNLKGSANWIYPGQVFVIPGIAVEQKAKKGEDSPLPKPAVEQGGKTTMDTAFTAEVDGLKESGGEQGSGGFIDGQKALVTNDLTKRSTLAKGLLAEGRKTIDEQGGVGGFMKSLMKSQLSLAGGEGGSRKSFVANLRRLSGDDSIDAPTPMLTDDGEQTGTTDAQTADDTGTTDVETADVETADVEATDVETTDVETTKAEEVKPPENPGTDYPAYNELIKKLVATRTSYLGRYETVRFMGSATAFEKIGEELEAVIADLTEERELAKEAIERGYDASYYTQKADRDAADARLKEVGSGAELAEEKALLQSERDQINETFTELQNGHREGDAFYQKWLSFEFSQLEALKTTIESGEIPSEALSESYAESLGGKIDFGNNIDGWVTDFEGRIKASWGSFSGRYQAVQFSGSMTAFHKLGRELDKVITEHKREKEQGFEKFKLDSKTETELLKQLKGDIGGYLEKAAVEGKGEYRKSNTCMDFIARYKGKKDTASAEKLANEIEGRIERIRLSDDKAFSNADLDLDFELNQLDALKSAIEGGAPVSRADKPEKLEFGESSASWIREMSDEITATWQDFDHRRVAVMYSGSAQAPVKLGFELGLTIQVLTYKQKKGAQHFEDLLEERVQSLEDKRRELAEGESDADINKQIDTLREEQDELKLSEKSLEDELSNLEILKTAIESGFGPVAAAGPIGQADVTAESFEDWSRDMGRTVNKAWDSYNERYQGIVFSGATEAVARVGRDLEQETAGLQKGRERSIESYSRLYKKRIDGITRIKEAITYGRTLESRAEVINPYDTKQTVDIAKITSGYSPGGEKQSYTSITAELDREVKRLNSRRDDVVKISKEELDRCFKKLSTLKESITSGKKALKADEASQFSEGESDLMDVSKASDVTTWSHSMVTMIQQLHGRLEGQYNMAWASGSAPAVELFKERFEQKIEVLSTRMSSGITHFDRAHETELEEREKSEGKLTAEQRTRANQDHKKFSREANVRIKTAYLLIEQLKSDIDGGLRGGTATEGVATEEKSGARIEIEASDYPEWLDKFAGHLRTYRKTQLKIYRTEVWASGSLSACQKMGMRISQQVKIFKFEDTNRAEAFKEKYDLEQDALDVLKLKLESDKEEIDKAKYKGTPAWEFAQMIGTVKNQRIIELIDDACEKNDELREKRMAPRKRVVDEEVSLIEELASTITEGKRARAKLDRDPQVGEDGQAGGKTDGRTQTPEEVEEREERERKTAWPLELPAGHWSLSVSNRPSESVRAVVFKAREGRGNHELSKGGQIVVVKSRSEQPWMLGVRYLEGETWERSRVQLVEKGGWFQVDTDDKAGTAGFKDTTQLEIKPHKEAPKKDGVTIPAGLYSVRVAEKNAGYSQRFTISGADSGNSVNDGNKPGKVVEVKSSKAWSLLAEHNDGKGWDPNEHRRSDTSTGYRVNTEDWIDNDYNDLILDVNRQEAEQTEQEGPKETRATDASMKAALAVLSRSAKAAGRITGADFQRAVIIGMEDLDGQAGLKGNEYADLLTYVQANIRLMDGDAKAKFEVVKEHCAQAPGSGMALKIFNAMISKMQVTVGAVDEPVDSGVASRFRDASMGQAIARLEAEAKANGGTISGAVFEKAIIIGMGDLDGQAGSLGIEWAEMVTYVATNLTRMDNDAKAKFEVLKEYVGKARGRGMAVKLWLEMLRKIAVTVGPDEEAPKKETTPQTGAQETTGGGGDGAPGKGIKLPPGDWTVVVKEKNAGFSQRFVVTGAQQGSGAHHKQTPGDSVDVSSSKVWYLDIEHKNGKRPWASSKLRWKAGSNTLFSEDWTDNDYNDFILKLNPRTVKEPGSSTPPPDTNGKEETSGDGGVLLPPGLWRVMVTDKVAAFQQRFIITKADRGMGEHDFQRIGQKVEVESGRVWNLQVRHKNGKKPWTPSKHRLSPLKGGDFRVNTEDWTDNDYNDLVLKVSKLPPKKDGDPTSGKKKEGVAANETAKFWGDPHFVGADGGKFDVQGEPGKVYNLLTDKGLTYYGRFDGWGGMVTVVGQTTITMSGDDGRSVVIFEPKTNTATVDGKKVPGQASKTPAGGVVKKTGNDLIVQTAEGYEIIQHARGSGARMYIDSEVNTGKQGVAMDGVMPGGLLGQTFDEDKAAKNGKAGKGAQGEGAIEGHYTDYQVSKTEGETFEKGRWIIVIDKALANKRFVVEGAQTGNGPSSAGGAHRVAATGPWSVRIEDNIEVDKSRKKWIDLWLQKKNAGGTKGKPKFTLGAAKVWSDKFDQMKLNLEKTGEVPRGAIDDSKPIDRKPKKSPGVMLPPGSWDVAVAMKQAAFSQQFTVEGALEGSGTHDGNKVGTTMKVKADRLWRLKVDHNDGKGWSASKHQLDGTASGFRVSTEDWTDNDFNDLVLDVRRSTEGGTDAPSVDLNPTQAKGLTQFQDRLQKAHVRPKMIDPLATALEISADRDRAGLKKAIKPIARRAKDHEVETVTTHEQILKSSVRTAKEPGSRMLQMELEKLARKRGLTDEPEGIEQERSEEGSPRHLNVDLDPNLQTKIDEKLTGSSEKRDVNRHRQMAQEAEKELAKKRGTRQEKRRHADELERIFSGLLPGKIGMSITFREGEGGSDKMQDIEIRIAPNDTVLNTVTQVTDDENPFQPIPVLSKSEKKSYKRMVDQVEESMEASQGSLSDKLQQARELEYYYNPQIRNPTQMDISFIGAPDDGEQEGEARIAPDDAMLIKPHNKKDDIVEDFEFKITAPLGTLSADGIKGLNPEEKKTAGDAFAALSGEDRNEIEILLKLSAEVKKADARAFLVSLAGRPAKVSRSVVVLLGAGFSELLDRADYEQIWKDQACTGAVLKLLRMASNSFARKMIVELLSTPFFSFDWSVDRFEARLAWELLLTLPHPERIALLTSTKGFTKDEAEEELRKKIQGRLQINLSREYAESSRYDTYGGDKGADGLYDQSTIFKSDTGETKEAKEKANTEATQKTAIYQSTIGTDKAVARDTDRQSLLSLTLDDALWTGPEGKLKAVLKMVIQADEADFVGSMVHRHWAKHTQLFMSLGFLQDGRWAEHIKDETFSTWFGRLLAGATVVWDAIKFAILDASVVQVDLQTVSKSWVANDYGLRLEEVKNPKDALSLILGGADYAATAMGILGLGPAELLDTISMGTASATKIYQRIKDNRTLKEADSGKLGERKDLVNQLVITQDDRTGSTHITIPAMPIAGQAAIFGENTIKTGAAALVNAQIQIKKPTAKSHKEHISASIKKVIIHDLMIITPQGMTSIGSLELDAMFFTAEGFGVKPTGMLARILADIQHAVIDVIQLLPGWQAALIGGVAGMVSDGLQLGLKATYDKLSSGDIKQLSFGFGGIQIKNVVDSKGNAIDSVTVGATDLTAAPELSALLNWKGKGELSTEIKRHTTDLAEVTADLGKAESGSMQHEVLTEQKVWLTESIERLNKQLAHYDDLEPKYKTLKSLSDGLDKLNAKDPAALTDGERQWMSETSSRISALRMEMALMMGASASGTLGAINIKGVDWEGTKVGEVSISKMKLTGGGKTTDGKKAGGGLETEEDVTATVTDVQIGGGQRRDLAIPAEILAINKRQSKLEVDIGILMLLDDGRGLNAETLGRVKAMEAEHSLLQEAREQLKQELKDLQPLLVEYDILRQRMTDVDNPLTIPEKTRLQQLKTQLTQPPSITIEQINLSGISLSGGSSDVMSDETTGITGGLSVQSTSIVGFKQTGSGYGLTGDTTIESIGMTGTSASLDLSGSGALDLKSDELSLVGIHSGGTGEAVQKQSQEIAAELKQVQDEIKALSGKSDKTSADRLVQLKKREEILKRRQGELAGKAGEQEALDVFIAETTAAMAGLVDGSGNDRSRSYSHNAAIDGVSGVRALIADTKSGKKRGADPYEVCIDNADRLVTSYEAAKLELKTEIDARQKPGGTTTLEDRSREAHRLRDLTELKSQYEAVKAQLKIWKDHQLNLKPQLDRLQGELSGLVTLRDRYAALVEKAKGKGVDPVKLGAGKLDDISAAGMIKVATAQKSGWESTDVTAINVRDANLHITGLQHVMGADEGTGAWTGAVQLTSSDKSKPMVGSLTVEGVKQGDRVIKSLSLDKIDGKITVEQSGTDQMKIKVEDFSLGTLTMKGLDWQSATMSVKTDSDIVLDGISADLHVELLNGAMFGSIDAFDITTMTAAGMRVEYGDYIFDMGKTSGGKTDLKAVSVRDYDLTTGSFSNVTLGALTTEGLRGDLGGGMTIGAKKMSMGKLSIGAVVTDKAKEKQHEKSTEDSSGLVSDGSDAGANRYSIDMTGVNADQMRVKMEESGVDVKIDRIKDASLTGFSIDLLTGEFALQRAQVKGINIGQVKYAADGMKFSATGMKMASVLITARGQLNYDEAAIEKSRSAGRVPDSVKWMIFDRISVTKASMTGIDMTTKDATGASMALELPVATADELVITGYNVMTGSMDLSLKGAAMEGLGVEMSNRMSTTTLNGNVDIESLKYKALYDRKGNPVSTDVDFAGVDATDFSYSSESHEVIDGGKKSGQRTKTTTSTQIDQVKGISGQVGMTEQNGETKTTFTNISVSNVGLSTLAWGFSGGGDVSDVSGQGVQLRGIKVTGHTVTRMKEETLSSGQTVALPESDMYLKEVKASSLAAKKLTYTGTTMGDDGNETSSTVTLSPATATDIQVLDLAVVEGKMTDGKVDIGRVDATMSASSETIGPKASSLLGAGGRLVATKLYMNVKEGGKTVELGSKGAITLSGASLSLKNDDGKLDIGLPMATATGLKLDLEDKSNDKEIHTAMKAHVDRIQILQDAPLEYFKTEKPERTVSDKSSEDLRKELAETQQSAKDTDRRFRNINWDSFLKTVNGNIALDANLDSNLKVEWDSSDWTYIDLLPDIDLSGADIKGSTVNIPVINGYINKELIQFTSDKIAFVLLELLPDLTTINLSWFSGWIKDAMKDDGSAGKLIKEELQYRKLVKQAYINRFGSIGDKEFEAIYDRVVERRYQSKVKTAEDYKRLAQELKGTDLDWLAPMFDSMHKVAVHGDVAHSEYADIYLDNFHINLSGGPMTSNSFFKDAAGDTSVEGLSIEKFKLNFNDAGAGKYAAAIEYDKLSYVSATKNARGDYEGMTARVGDTSLYSRITELLPKGRYYVVGGPGESEIKNPIKASLRKGSELEDVDVVTRTIYKD